MHAASPGLKIHDKTHHRWDGEDCAQNELTVKRLSKTYGNMERQRRLSMNIAEIALSTIVTFPITVIGKSGDTITKFPRKRIKITRGVRTGH